MRVCVLRGSLWCVVNNCESLPNVEIGQASPSLNGSSKVPQRFFDCSLSLFAIV